MFEVLGREITKTPIEEKGVLARIVKIDLLDISAKQFEITIELISGSHKGTLICDNKFHVHPQGKFNWRYNKLRKAINYRYKPDENIDIDFDKTFLNKYVYCFLTIFKTENYKGQELQFQNIEYVTNPFSKDYTNNLIQAFEEAQASEKQKQAEQSTQDNQQPFDDVFLPDIESKRPRKV